MLKGFRSIDEAKALLEWYENQGEHSYCLGS